MARTLSQDLWDRVGAAIDGGLSCHAAAARFGSACRAQSAGGEEPLSMAGPLPSRAAVTGIQARSKRTAASFGS